MNFSAMFFSSGGNSRSAYQLLFKVVEKIDLGPFVAIWTPERHFDEFGGAFPNPSVLSAAIAMVSKRLQIRAGSLISPLHDSIRIAEEWALVDNLSNGRAALSFGSGWNINDFVLAPGRYLKRNNIMWEQIREIQAIWSGETIKRQNDAGASVDLRVFPPPFNKNLPIWVTSSGNPETFVKAGAHGANVLTHLITQDLASLESKIALYRKSRRDHGHDPDAGTVSLMLHTFVTQSREQAVHVAFKPLRNYLRSAIDLEQQAAKGGGTISGGGLLGPVAVDDALMEELLDITTQRYLDSASLIGTVDSCSAFVVELTKIGVNEIACLLDFGIEQHEVLDGLSFLERLANQ